VVFGPVPAVSERVCACRRDADESGDGFGGASSLYGARAGRTLKGRETQESHGSPTSAMRGSTTDSTLEQSLETRWKGERARAAVTRRG